MNKNTSGSRGGMSTRTLAGVAIFTAIVVILQFIGSAIRLGPFSVSLVLVPIVIGAALYGIEAGVWLGFVFGIVVLLSGDAAAFLAVNAPGTIITCTVKGMAAGLLSGSVYALLSHKSDTLGVVSAAIAAPVCNTGVFLLFCRVFFMDTINAWAHGAGIENAGVYMLTAFVGVNFLLELVINIILAPVIVRLIRTARNIH